MPYTNVEEGRKYRREYQRTPQGKARHSEANDRWRRKNRRIHRAHSAISNAISRGKLQPWPVCAMPECLGVKIEAHHPDYDNVLGVVWLCEDHHKQIHKECYDTTI